MEKLGSRFRLAPSFTLLSIAAAAVITAASCSGGSPTTPCAPADSPACTDGCDPGETVCDGACVDTKTSAAHCGECGKACADGQICAGGACKDAPACDDGLTRCGGDCVDLKTSAAHCGECGEACDDGQACVDGACADSPCGEGLSRCGDDCVNLKTSAAHCGQCGKACADGEACSDGTCEDSPCDEGYARCGGACVNLRTNAAHCGQCGKACDAGERCVRGACEIDECAEKGLSECGGSCVDTTTSTQHCGECNNACSAAQICQGGDCACSIAANRDIGRIVPRSVTGTTVGGASVYNPSCVAASASEQVISFTAPSAGVYAFDASQSEYEVVIAIVDARGCAELACSAEPGAARVEVDLAADQTVYIVVDGKDGATGAFVVDVTRENEPTCPAGALSMDVPAHISGSTEGRPNSVRPSVTDECTVVEPASDAAYTFTAPVAGDYVFDTFGSEFDTLLHVRAETCGGAQIACNDDYKGSVQSSVTVPLEAGETVVVVVDGSRGRAGNFVLNVNRAIPPPPCDNTGFCGDNSSQGCRACAIKGNCRPQSNACGLSDSCRYFLDCAAVDCDRAANKDACVAQCADEYPEGAALVEALYTCIYCSECRNDCADVGFTCP